MGLDDSKNEGDELELDLRNIFSFFKSKRSEPKESTVEEHKNPPTTQSGSHDSEEFSLNLSAAALFLKRHYLWLLLLVPIFLSIYFRMTPASLPITEEWAKNNVHNFIKQDLLNFVNQNYPNLPITNKNRLIEEEFSKAIKQDFYQVKTGQYQGQSFRIADQIKQNAELLKEFWQYESNGKKFVYMPDIDPYTYLRYARNLLEKGHVGDEIRNGLDWDNHMIAPLGAGVDKTGHPYVLLALYKIIKIFKPSADLMNAATYFPIIFSTISVIPAFFIGRKLAGNVGGLFASTMLAIHPAFLNRTTWGHSDTDAYVIFFALFISWLFLEALEVKKLSKKLALSTGAGVLTGLFTYFWGGWWHILDFMLATAGIYFFYLLFINLKANNIKNIESYKILLIVITFILAAIFIGSIFIGFKGVLSAPLGPFRFMRIKEATKLSLWPNVYTTVAELNEASFSQIVNVIGGKFLFVLILAGIALAALKRDGQGKLDPKYLILLLIWFVATIYASTKGIRFTMLIVPPLSIAFGTFIGKAFEYANGFCERSLHLSKKVVAPVLLLLFAIALFSPAKAWYQSTINDIPIVNDAWWNTLTKIRQESQPNAIINSWWDFGHHFKYIADRAVTFDGASQNKPMAHWIGKVLLTGNEEEAIGILRMLDCGSNSAFKELDKKINDASKTVKLLYELVVLDKSGAEKLLKENGLLKDEIQNVLRYTHCEPPEDYFITSDDMISKAGVWAHFGSWNFDRADLWLSRNEPKEKFVQKAVKDNNYSQEEALRLYTELQGIKTEREGNSWIAPWPNYASGLASCSQKKNIVECNNGITINLENYSATIPTNNGIIQPSSVVYVEGPDVVEKKFNTSNDLSLSLIPVEGGYQVILMQKELGLSMFNRLYFFRGHGLRHFKLFDAQRQLSGGWIYTWKVDWDGGDKNEVYVSEKQNKTTEVIKVEDEQESTNKSSTNGAENVTSTVLVE